MRHALLGHGHDQGDEIGALGGAQALDLGRRPSDP